MPKAILSLMRKAQSLKPFKLKTSIRYNGVFYVFMNEYYRRVITGLP